MSKHPSRKRLEIIALAYICNTASMSIESSRLYRLLWINGYGRRTDSYHNRYYDLVFRFCRLPKYYARFLYWRDGPIQAAKTAVPIKMPPSVLESFAGIVGVNPEDIRAMIDSMLLVAAVNGDSFEVV